MLTEPCNNSSATFPFLPTAAITPRPGLEHTINFVRDFFLSPAASVPIMSVLGMFSLVIAVY